MFVFEEVQGVFGFFVFDDFFVMQIFYQIVFDMMMLLWCWIFFDWMCDIFYCCGFVIEFLEIVLGEIIFNVEICGEVMENVEGVFFVGYV